MSDFNWITEIPSNWRAIRIKQCCIDCFSGGTPSTLNLNYWNGNIAWIVSGACHDDYVNKATKYITKLGLDNSSTKMIPIDSPLLAMTGATCGNTGFLTISACANQSVFAYIIDKIIADPKYVWRSLIACKEYILSMQTGGAQGGINGEKCKNIVIPLPPLPVQNKIVEILDDKISKIDALIENENKQIEKLDEYKKAVITRAVTKGLDFNAKMKKSGIVWIGEIPEGWKVSKVKFLSTSIDKGNGITKDQVFADGDIQCIRYGEIYTRYNNSFEKTFSHTRIADITTPVYLNYGDILCAGTGELVEEIGKNVVYMGKEPCVVGGDIIIVRHKINPIFFNYALNCQASQFQKSYGKAKLKVVHASAFDIANVMIALPSMNEQQQIADYLDEKCEKINRIIEIKKSKKEKLQDYKKSLIYEYVTGKKEVSNV